jgi:hypothetical protein
MAQWVELWDRARRAMGGALTTYTAEHNLPSDFNDRLLPGAPADGGLLPAPVPLAPGAPSGYTAQP